MTKYKITLSMSCVKEANFVMEAKDPDELHGIIGEMDSNFLENNLEWHISDMTYPKIDNYEKVHRDTPTHRIIQKEAQQIQKAWEAL